MSESSHPFWATYKTPLVHIDMVKEFWDRNPVASGFRESSFMYKVLFYLMLGFFLYEHSHGVLRGGLLEPHMAGLSGPFYSVGHYFVHFGRMEKLGSP